MAIQEIKRRNMSQQVFEQLRGQIVSGEWKPGDKLPSENALCQLLGVSRVTIRSALSKLASLGLIVSRQGEGTFVQDVNGSQVLNTILPTISVSPDDLHQFLEFRRVLECESAHIAAQRATPEQLERITRCADLFEEHKDDMEAAAQYDFDFHREIIAATGNNILLQVFMYTQEYLTAALIMNVRTIGTASGVYYHRAIADAIRMQSPDLARSLMLEHLMKSEVGPQTDAAAEEGDAT